MCLLFNYGFAKTKLYAIVFPAAAEALTDP